MTSARSALRLNSFMRCSGVRGLQGGNGHPLELFVFLVGQTIKLVDVAARTDDVDVGEVGSQASQVVFHLFPNLFAHCVTQHAHGTYVVGKRLYQHAVRQEIDFGASTAHIDVDVVAGTVFEALHVVVVNHTGLFLSVDDFDADTRIFQYFLDDGLAVTGVAHGRGGAGAVVGHFVYLHQLAEGFHQATQFHGFAVRKLAQREDVETQAEGHTEHHHLRQPTADQVFVFFFFLNQEPHGVRADIDGGITFLTHIFFLFLSD